jgi:NADH-quinone oxidoreductase subunit E
MEAKSKSKEIDLTRLEDLLRDYKIGDESFLVPLLQAAQSVYGYLPMPVLERIAEHLKISMSRVYGVTTFYAQFHLTPHGRNTIRVCRGTACHIRGGKAVLEALERVLGIKAGETTEDMKFSLETVACLGTCFLSPVMMINDKYFGKLTPKKAEEILGQYQSRVTGDE